MSDLGYIILGTVILLICARSANMGGSPPLNSGFHRIQVLKVGGCNQWSGTGLTGGSVGGCIEAAQHMRQEPGVIAIRVVDSSGSTVWSA